MVAVLRGRRVCEREYGQWVKIEYDCGPDLDTRKNWQRRVRSQSKIKTSRRRQYQVVGVAGCSPKMLRRG
jgi:hypothetical protein